MELIEEIETSQKEMSDNNYSSGYSEERYRQEFWQLMFTRDLKIALCRTVHLLRKFLSS